MCNWLEDLMTFWFPEPVEQDIDGEPVEHDWYCPLPEIPEMYKLDTATADKADAYVRGALLTHEDIMKAIEHLYGEGT